MDIEKSHENKNIKNNKETGKILKCKMMNIDNTIYHRVPEKKK